MNDPTPEDFAVLAERILHFEDAPDVSVTVSLGTPRQREAGYCECPYRLATPDRLVARFAVG